MFLATLCETISVLCVFLQTTTVHESFSAMFTRIPLFHRMKHLMLPHILLSCKLALTLVTLESLVCVIAATHFVGQVKFQLVTKPCHKTAFALTLERALGGVVVELAQFVGSLESVSTASTWISHHWTSFLCFDHPLPGVMLLLSVIL